MATDGLDGVGAVRAGACVRVSIGAAGGGACAGVGVEAVMELGGGGSLGGRVEDGGGEGGAEGFRPAVGVFTHACRYVYVCRNGCMQERWKRVEKVQLATRHT